MQINKHKTSEQDTNSGYIIIYNIKLFIELITSTQYHGNINPYSSIWTNVCACIHIYKINIYTFLWLHPNITLQWNISVLDEENGKAVFYYSI